MAPRCERRAVSVLTDRVDPGQIACRVCLGRSSQPGPVPGARVVARIKSGDLTTVEGAFLTDEDLVELVYVESDGRRVTSSLTGSGYDLSLFRLRYTS
jgi:hypothetical protein